MEDLKLAKAIDTKSFYNAIDNLVIKHNMKYIDAIVFFCENNDVEIETAASMIASNYRIKSLLKMEGEELHYITKTAKLPV